MKNKPDRRRNPYNPRLTRNLDNLKNICELVIYLVSASTFAWAVVNFALPTLE